MSYKLSVEIYNIVLEEIDRYFLVIIDFLYSLATGNSKVLGIC